MDKIYHVLMYSATSSSFHNRTLYLLRTIFKLGYISGGATFIQHPNLLYKVVNLYTKAFILSSQKCYHPLAISMVIEIIPIVVHSLLFFLVKCTSAIFCSLYLLESSVQCFEYNL